MKAIIIRANHDKDDIVMELGIGNTDVLAVDAINERWTITPLAWEYDENVYNLVMIAPAYLIATQIVVDATSIINEYVKRNVKACHSCMIDDSELSSIIGAV